VNVLFAVGRLMKKVKEGSKNEDSEEWLIFWINALEWKEFMKNVGERLKYEDA